MTPHSHRCTPVNGIATSVHDHGMVVLDIDKGRLFAVNQVGAFIWQRVQQGLTPPEIALQVSRDFGVPYSTVYEHVLAFLADLARHRLLVKSSVV
jgi:Coenzyme PQQ synthesis protein D (PqqD)